MAAIFSKTIVITGATSGIGEQTALALAKQGHVIYMLVRNVKKGEEVKANIIAQSKNDKVYVIACDLSDLASVKRAADELKAKLVSVQALINNAGGTVPTRELSKDGYEMTFALNHLGHFLLTLSLMPLLEKGQARVINVSSDAHGLAKVDLNDLQMEKEYSAMRAYANAKLFNIYFARSLAEKYADKGITAYSLHPGVVKTSFGVGLTGFFKWVLWLGRPFMISPEKGAITSVYLATAPKIESMSGKYFQNKKERRSSALSDDSQMREKIWDVSLQMIKKYL